MKATICLIVCIAISLIFSSISNARPKKGFHSGPYLTLEVGMMQMGYDTDQVTGEGIGRTFEPAIGFLFGWSLSDYVSVELQGRYATNLKTARREHIGSGNVYGKYTFIFDSLTDFKSLRILPFLKAGMGVRAAVIPGNPDATKDTVVQFGWGPSPGAGIAFLWHKYFYFGVDLQGDLLIVDDIRQTVSGVPATLVYKGGFYPSFSASAMIGVHY